MHNALKRLEEQGEVRALKDQFGKLTYQWIPSIEQAMKKEEAMPIKIVRSVLREALEKGKAKELAVKNERPNVVETVSRRKTEVTMPPPPIK